MVGHKRKSEIERKWPRKREREGVISVNRALHGALAVRGVRQAGHKHMNNASKMEKDATQTCNVKLQV